MSQRILISGASVAGNATAWWLAEYGFDVTVVEKAPAFRDGGQNIDVRGLGREVLRRMGLERAALDRGTGERGTAWVDEDGRPVAEFRVDDTGTDGPTAEMEILRGDLARLLYDAVGERATFRFGATVASVGQDTGGVDVTFADGTADRFDALIIAEGVGSPTRDMIFPGENNPRWMDLTMGYFTIPRIDSDDRMWRWYHASGGRSISLRPDNHGTARAMLSVQGPAQGEQDFTREQQKAYLRDRFADAGWQAPRVLAGMEETQDFYFDVLRQVRMPRWSNSRVALVGDAAWCATPLAGIGTTLAITGAYILAGELSRAQGTVQAFEAQAFEAQAFEAQAFAAYERFMRPIVDKGQGVPKIVPRLMNPHTKWGVHLLHGVLRVASSRPVRGIAARFIGNAREQPALPDYPRRTG